MKKKGAIEISKLLAFILMVFAVIMIIIIIIFGFSSIKDVIMALIDSFISFLGFD